MPKLILLNKPYGVICQFSPSPPHASLADFVPIKDVYPAGRLDTDSEGLLLLTDSGPLQAKIADPKHKLAKTYWVQVEGSPTLLDLQPLLTGVNLGDFTTQPAQVRIIEEPAQLWPRIPPVRFRASVPTTWLEIIIREGKNRQVRRMTAKVGFPTLRLVRYAIGDWTLDHLPLGTWREEFVAAPRQQTPVESMARPKQRGRRGPNKTR
ncbi:MULTISPECIES: pseudouridine synthase [unclassified Iodobacter]|uniref:pseudouridine synthase n=1 Tax=unclassified Iodobacter TaxID=235634 RepID=UPI0025D1CEA0|nr:MULTISPECIES: pseudouridine synthase [unclassified Iodobacter]MDW5415149.1 pseudouridine synthase [Iodobacter sp. CM08]